MCIMYKSFMISLFVRATKSPPVQEYRNIDLFSFTPFIFLLFALTYLVYL